mgnify:CR=1 FL=1
MTCKDKAAGMSEDQYTKEQLEFLEIFEIAARYDCLFLLDFHCFDLFDVDAIFGVRLAVRSLWTNRLPLNQLEQFVGRGRNSEKADSALPFPDVPLAGDWMYRPRRADLRAPRLEFHAREIRQLRDNRTPFRLAHVEVKAAASRPHGRVVVRINPGSDAEAPEGVVSV